MNINIRKTLKEDFFITEFNTREAFWNLYKPGADEHLALKQLRESGSYIPELDLVALLDNQVIGHIICTKAKVMDESDREHTVLCAGPLSVISEHQKKGYGAELMMYSINTAKELGYKGIILFGNPEYYKKFGFKNAEEYGITTRDGKNFEPFMALELYDGALQNVKGRFFEDDAFFTNADVLEEYEKQFPYKEKLVTDTQLKF